jgi:inosose dehydratase
MLAAAPITWGVCELPNWGTVLPYERVLDEIAAAGFTGTELGPPGYLPDDPAALRAALHARALQLVGAFCPLPLSAPDGGRGALDEAVALARTLAEAGCHTLVAADAGDERRRAIAGRVTTADGLPPEHWQHAADCLTELARRCAALDVRVVFHQHAGSYVETADELDALLAASPPDAVGVCLDTGHLVYGGADPAAVAERYGPRVWHVHLKDVSAPLLQRVREHGTDYSVAVGQGVFTPLGGGCVDFGRLVAVLKASGYAGWWVLEQDIRLGPPWPEQEPRRNARQSLEHLRAPLT